MGITISTHNGHAVSREHNIRNEKIVSKESHINPNGVHEIWHDEKHAEAYERIFGASVRAYNEKQQRADRKIDNYYKNVCNDDKRHAVYEMIVGVYGKDENGASIVPTEQGKEILREFVDTWQERNPNLEMIGAYYHDDEEGEPHVHIDYVPVAHGYKRGMETQNGLDKALREMGYSFSNTHATPQIQWEKAQNDYLDKLCRDRGYEVEHPMEQGVKHLHTTLYKAQQALESTIDHTNDLERQNKALETKLERLGGNVKLAEDFKNLKADKGLFGKTKDKVTLEWKTYNDLVKTATKVEDVQKHEKSVEEREYRVARRESQSKEDMLKAQKALQDAQKIKDNAKSIVQEQAQRAVNMAVQQFMQGLDKEEQKKIKRMENYLKGLQFPDGRNGLEVFEQREEQYREAFNERGKRSIHRTLDSLKSWNDYFDEIDRMKRENPSSRSTRSRSDWDLER